MLDSNVLVYRFSFSIYFTYLRRLSASIPPSLVSCTIRSAPYNSLHTLLYCSLRSHSMALIRLVIILDPHMVPFPLALRRELRIIAIRPVEAFYSISIASLDPPSSSGYDVKTAMERAEDI